MLSGRFTKNLRLNNIQIYRLGMDTGLKRGPWPCGIVQWARRKGMRQIEHTLLGSGNTKG